MPVLFAMSIAGSIPLIGCWFLWIVFRTDFPAKWGLRLLRISIFFYLVPFQLIRHIMPADWHYFLYQRNDTYTPEIISYSYEGEFIIPWGERYIWLPRWLGILLILWLLCTVCFAIYQIGHYLYFMKAIKKTAIPSSKINHSPKTPLLIHTQNKQPFSVGFLKSYIILPDKNVSPEQQDYIYRHELSHIQRHDAVFKLLCLVVFCLHCFNPLTWFLLKTYATFCEYASDESVTATLSPESQKEYSVLLVEMSAEKDTLPFIWSNNFLNGKHNLKRRITRIMKKRNLSPRKKIFVSLLIILLTLSSTVTLLAYEPPILSYHNPLLAANDGDDIIYNGEDIIFDYEFVPSGMESQKFKDPFEDLDFSLSDTIWKLDDGSIIPIYTDDVPSQRTCKHNYKTGEEFTHQSNNSGGCTLTKYRITRCLNCGHEKSRQRISSVTYEPCPHK